jgi:anti-sigma B factor antagonist
MELAVTYQQNIPILIPKGRFDAYESPQVEAWLEDNIGANKPFVIFQMDETNFIDTRALTVLVKWLKKTRELDGDLKLAKMAPPIRVIFELSKLNQAFDIYDTLEDALESIDTKPTPSVDVQEKQKEETNSVALKHDGNTSILNLSGRIDAFIVPQIKEKLTELETKRSIIINLLHVDFLDSAGLAVLVRILKQARSQEGEAILVRSQSETANRILTLTRFDKVFTIYGTLEEAVQHFGA